LENKKEIKKYTLEETKKNVLKIFRAEGDLNYNLEKLGDILPKLLSGNKEEVKEAREISDTKVTEVMMALETDTHWGLMSSFRNEYRGMAKEFSDQLIKDYNCTTVAEKALVEIIANAFIRIIDNSRRLNDNLGDGGTTINENKTKYFTMLSLQIDRANRQFLNALVALKQFKAPTIEMNIKTNTAFISNNQQVNVNKDENIKAQ
jgi:hypothetical protein